MMSKFPTIHCLNTILEESFKERSKTSGNSSLENTDRKNPSIYSNWITIKNLTVARTILASLGDDDKKNILNAVLDKPRTFMEIMEITKLPSSSGYRKVCSLLDNGLLIELNSNINSGGKRKIKYKSIFQNIEINIEKNKIIIKILLTKEALGKYIEV